RHQGVWIVRFQVPAVDPDNLLDAWFSSHAVFGTKVYPMNVPVSYYDLVPKLAEVPSYAKRLDARFGDAAALRGIYLPVTSGSARDSRLHPPSNWVEVLLYWETLKPGADFRPRVRFTDGNGQVYGGDLNGEAGFAPVVTWKSGEIWQAIS